MKVRLEKMLAFVDKLNEIDTEGIDPLIYMSEEGKCTAEKIRLQKKLLRKDALKNAPEKDSDYFKVPTVLKK